MSIQNLTRSGGNAPALPGTRPFGTLSRRAAIIGAVAVAGLGARGVAQAADIAAPAVRASPDAALIAFANRVLALANRCEAVSDHRITLEDRITRSCPRPKPLPRPSAFSVDMRDTTATERVFTATKSPTYDAEHAAWERATAAAQTAHEQQEDAMAVRLGLPEVERRSERMSRRCDRWATQLVAMRPATVEGLGAKASALLVLVGDDSFSMEVARHADLVMSVMADAVRLGTRGQA